MAGRAELDEAVLADLAHGVLGGLEIGARVELVRLLGQDLADRAGDGQAVVGVDIDLAHAVLDAALDLFHRHAPGLGNGAAVLVDDVLQFLGNRRGAVHHQVGVGQALVDLLDHVHGQDVAVRLARELVGPVAGAHGDGQGVDAGALDELDRLVGIGQQLVMAEHALEAVAVFRLAHAAFQRAQHAQFAFNRHAAGVGHLDHLAGDLDVVLVGGGGLGVLHQRAVHHHRGEAVLDRRGAGGRAVAVVLVHAHRDVGIDLGQGVDHPGQHDVVGVVRAPRDGLDDDRGVDGFRRLHDRQALFHVVDVEGRQRIVMLRRMIQQLS